MDFSDRAVLLQRKCKSSGANKYRGYHYALSNDTNIYAPYKSKTRGFMMFSGREEKDMCKNTSSKSARKTSSVIHGNSSSIFMSFFIRP